MADGDEKLKPAGTLGFGAVKHGGTGATVIVSTGALSTANVQYSFVFHGSINSDDDTGILDQLFLVHVKRTTGGSWQVSSQQIGSSLGALAVTGWSFAMNGDALEASSTATADEMSMGRFTPMAAELSVVGA